MNIQGREFTVGADPEIFVGRDGKFVSGHGLIPGTKEQPFLVKQGAVQVDGMALEFNIDPASSEEEFQNNLDAVQNQLRSMIGDLEFLGESSVVFDKEFMSTIPYENLALGCDPDFNAYTLRPNNKPEASSLMRTVGGHLHVGGFHTETPESFEQITLSAQLAKALDETLGVYSLFWDFDDKRREMYGQAGCFRPKSYGMEYRTLSNKWIFNRKLVSFVYKAVEAALNNLSTPGYTPNQEVQEIINTSDRNHNFFNNNPQVDFITGVMREKIAA